MRRRGSKYWVGVVCVGALSCSSVWAQSVEGNPSGPAPAATVSDAPPPDGAQAPAANASASAPSADWSHGGDDRTPSYRWYLAPRVGGVISDSDRRTHDSALGGLGLGVWINPRFALDLEGTINNANFDHSSGRSGKQWESTGVGLTGRWYTGAPSDANRFYLLGGVGAQRHAAVSGDSGWSPAATLGAGFQHAFSDRVAMRAELAARHDWDNDSSRDIPALPRRSGYTDGLVSVGLVVGLDHIPRPVAPSPPPPPPAAPDCSQKFRNGVNLCENKCPDLPEGTIVGPDGCPQKVVIDLRGVNFKFDRPKKGEKNLAPTLKDPASDGTAILDQAIDVLQRNPNVTVEIDGYTDNIGTVPYNQSLSERRAQIVSDYLLAHGVAPDRIRAVQGFGKTHFIAPNDTADGRAMNRRVELNPNPDAGTSAPPSTPAAAPTADPNATPPAPAPEPAPTSPSNTPSPSQS